MKKYAALFLIAIMFSGCHHSSSPTPSSPPATTPTSTAPANVTALCGVWHLDSTRQFRANPSGYPTSDTLLGAVVYYTTPTETLSLQSSTTSYTYGTEVISGYAYSGVGTPSPYYTSGTTAVWNISGDTLRFPTTNHPNACTEYWTIKSQTTHALVVTNRVWGSHCASGAQGPSYYEWDYQNWYYHK